MERMESRIRKDTKKTRDNLRTAEKKIMKLKQQTCIACGEELPLSLLIIKKKLKRF